MRRKTTYAAVLLLLVACAAQQSQKVRQMNYSIAEGYKQVAIFLDAKKLTADEGEAIIAALDVAGKQVDRYWEAVRNDAPQDVRKAILAAIEDALAEANRILLAREARK